MPVNLKFHFQEGFVGEYLEIRRQQGVAASLSPRTRTQIGLAATAEIDAEPGETLAIVVPQAGLAATVIAPAPGGAQQILVNRDEHGLRITTTEDEPGYL